MKLLAFLLLPLFTLSEVVDDFSKCNGFFLDNKPPNFSPMDNSVKHICQCLWDNKTQPIYLYATLYSTAWKIPIYSAYVFGKRSIGRCDAWYVEPQLDGKTKPEACMQPKGRDKTIGTNQAVNCDYEDSDYDKGHLYPVLHTNNHLSMLATSTLTNAAPQDPDFNQGSWLKHERDVMNELASCDKAYVVTGVVPDLKKEKMNGKVTMSKFYWRATCCQKKNQGDIKKGYYGPDNNGKVQENLTIQQLEEWLKSVNIDITIFPTLKRPRE